MQGATFATIAQEGMKLSEMTPVGYLENKTYTDKKKGKGCQGDIYIVVLNANGGTAIDGKGNERRYKWYHAWDKTNGWAEKGKWIQPTVDGDIEIGGANEVVFGNGEALWINVATAFESGMTINNAGEALLDAAVLALRDGAKGMSAPISAACKLSKILPSGYLTNATYTDKKKGKGCQGDIYIVVLNANGGTAIDGKGNECRYKWYHAWDKTNGWAEKGKWVQPTVDGDIEITDANDVEFAMGEGLWVNVATAYEDGMMLGFPGVDDLK